MTDLSTLPLHDLSLNEAARPKAPPVPKASLVSLAPLVPKVPKAPLALPAHKDRRVPRVPLGKQDRPERLWPLIYPAPNVITIPP